MDAVQFFLLFSLLALSTLFNWMQLVIAWHSNKRQFNKFAMDLDRLMDGDDAVRTKLLNLEKKMQP